MPTIKSMRDRVSKLTAELKEAESALTHYVNNCRHTWSKIEEVHQYIPSYTIPGDEPGTMGVDWRGPIHVPAQENKQWKRVCENCGKEEITSNTNQHITYTPRF
jgi:hypothetical protein